jgi:hypothetical protein
MNDEPGMDAWPLDLNDDRKANTTDVGRFVGSLNASDTDPRYNQRYDLNMDGSVNTLDIGKYALALNRTC